VDGTLLRSNDAHAHAWVEAYREFGYDVAFERVRPLIGMGGDKLMAAVTPGLNDQEGVGKQIAQRRKEIFLSRYVATLQPTSGARELVQYLRDRGKALAVASSAKRDELEALLTAARVAELFREATTSSDVQESKPAPDAVAVALQKIGLPPEQVLMVGDTPYDVESAARSHMGTIAVRCGGWDDAVLGDALAVYGGRCPRSRMLAAEIVGDATAHVGAQPTVRTARRDLLLAQQPRHPLLECAAGLLDRQHDQVGLAGMLEREQHIPAITPVWPLIDDELMCRLGEPGGIGFAFGSGDAGEAERDAGEQQREQLGTCIRDVVTGVIQVARDHVRLLDGPPLIRESLRDHECDFYMVSIQHSAIFHQTGAPGAHVVHWQGAAGQGGHV
jgi:HAD superfamily hydrolase (TIGR01509 family)